MSVNIQTANGLKLLADKTTKETIKTALGYTPANEDNLGNYLLKGDAQSIYATLNDLSKYLAKEDDGDSFSISDSAGNIIFRVDKDGIHSVDLFIKNKSILEIIEEAGFSGDYNDLTNKPIEQTGDDTEVIFTDNDGNIITKIDQTGVDAADLLIKGKSVNDIIDEKIDAIPEVDLSNYYTIPETDSLLANKSDTTHSHDDLISNSSEFKITDDSGNIITNIDSTGLHALNLFVGAAKDEVALQKNLQEAIDALDTKADVKHTHTYNDLTEKPNITDDENGSLQITDESGNIVATIDENGVTTTDLTLTGQAKITGNVTIGNFEKDSELTVEGITHIKNDTYVEGEFILGKPSEDDQLVIKGNADNTKLLVNDEEVATEKYIDEALAGINPSNQTVKTGSVTFGVSDVVEFKAGDNVTVTGDKSAKTITISAEAESHPATHPASMITGLSTVSTSGLYDDLIDRPVDIVDTEDYILQIRDDAENPIISVTDAGINAHKTLTVNGTNVALKSDLDSYVKTSEKGVANGVATLDENYKIPSSQLPSYVDDVLEYQTESNFPTTGESGKIYLAIETNKSYR